MVLCRTTRETKKSFAPAFQKGSVGVQNQERWKKRRSDARPVGRETNACFSAINRKKSKPVASREKKTEKLLPGESCPEDGGKTRPSNHL